MPCPLDAELAVWDGKDTAFLEALFRKNHDNSDFLESLIIACNTQRLQRGATWLLKQYFDQRGTPLPADLSRAHIGQFAGIEDWQAKLHVLQYLEHLDLADDAEAPLSDFLNETLQSDQKFVRAWSYWGLAVLAHRFPDRTRKTGQLLAEAQTRETAASVKVRIRKALDLLPT
ncbi:hypothetical protein [Roseibium sediminicola]|uniref:HEAT repeat domain-containing protein n=1 Tax=Roseibium sediminicola TaxID=2933272 RepID=A0ABT0GY96_9HYPH|nr:hypothetical protein [Roseibium sp. CAU 1639]MCK7614406.1 hypothetical protein [Roseibium sp. CAU 1639]